MKVRPIHPEFAAEIGGIELSRFVDHAVVDTIWEAIDRYAVLVFHDQHLDDEGLRNFASNFGELEIGRARRCSSSPISGYLTRTCLTPRRRGSVRKSSSRSLSAWVSKPLLRSFPGLAPRGSSSEASATQSLLRSAMTSERASATFPTSRWRGTSGSSSCVRPTPGS